VLGTNRGSARIGRLIVTCALYGVAGLVWPPVNLPAKEQPIRVIVSPRMAQAPAAVLVQVLLQPADENRGLEIAIDSGTYYRSSSIELSGAEAPRVHSVQFRSLPSGMYDVQVVLTGPGGSRRGYQRDQFHVQ
jgi:hypothetical protein